MKEGAPVQWYLRKVANILLFVLAAHKVIRSSVAPSEEVLEGHRMNELTEIPLQPSQIRRRRAVRKWKSGRAEFQGAGLSRRLLHRVWTSGKDLIVVANAVAQQGPHAAQQLSRQGHLGHLRGLALPPQALIVRSGRG